MKDCIDPGSTIHTDGWQGYAGLETKGYLKIFLGYASGVGKSFRMFDEARRRRERGQDVGRRRSAPGEIQNGVDRVLPVQDLDARSRGSRDVQLLVQSRLVHESGWAPIMMEALLIPETVTNLSAATS